MNLVIICHVYPPENAPAGIMVKEIAEDLSRAGHKITVITGWPSHPEGDLYPGWKARIRGGEDEGGAIKIIRSWHTLHYKKSLARRMLYYFSFGFFSFTNGLAIRSVDSVLCLSTPIFGSWSSWLLAKAKRSRFVYAIFDLHPESAMNSGLMRLGLLYKWLRRSDRSLCRKSDVILTLSENMRDSIARRGVEKDRIGIAPFWIDTDRIKPVPATNRWKVNANIPAGSFVCLYAGTMGYISGAEIIADVAFRLKERKDIRFLCVGEGSEKEKLIVASRSRGLTNIAFLPFQPAEELNEMFAVSDLGLITLLPAAGKTSNPSKILGYMAAGKPIVASVAEDSDTARIIHGGNCGWVVPPGDAEAMAASILMAAEHPDATKEAGRRGRAYAIERFSRKKCVEIYRRALEGRFADPVG